MQFDPAISRLSGQQCPATAKYAGQHDPPISRSSGQHDPQTSRFSGQNDPPISQFSGQHDPVSVVRMPQGVMQPTVTGCLHPQQARDVNGNVPNNSSTGVINSNEMPVGPPKEQSRVQVAYEPRHSGYVSHV